MSLPSGILQFTGSNRKSQGTVSGLCQECSITYYKNWRESVHFRLRQEAGLGEMGS